jgi:dienelactone hydrolase
MLAGFARIFCSIGPVALLMMLMVLHVSDAEAGQLVQFGHASENASTQELLGYLVKPDGAGPFPAVVVLHGCSGFSSVYTIMAERLKSWGYVALAIDSLGPRGRGKACVSGGRDGQPIDAYAGLNFLAAQHFVDPDRIGLLGYSMGGGSALIAAERGLIEQVFPKKFRAVVAYYPAFCNGRTGNMVAPTLILTGALDDWTPPGACRDLVKRAGDNGAGIDIVIYPNAYHAFDIPSFSAGRRYFGHWLEYDEAAATDALMQTHRFLDGHLVAHAQR